MKKSVVVLGAALLCISAAFANDGKIYSVDDEAYKCISNLFIAEGKAVPNATGPWSQAEMEAWIKSLPESYDNETSRRLYERAVSLVYADARFTASDSVKLNASGTFNPEVYVHTNKDFNSEDDWYYGFEQRQDILAFNGDISVDEHFYSVVKAGIGLCSGYKDDKDDENPYYDGIFHTNCPYVGFGNFGDLGKNYPQRAVMAMGGRNWNVSAGRDIVRWGSGETGNLFLGGNQLYDNSFRFAFFGDHMKFSFDANFYPHPETVENATNQFSADTSANVDGILVFLAHKMDFRFLNDRLNVGLGEGFMYQSASNTLDLRIFNPLIIYHNLFQRNQANSIMTVDADFAVIHGLNVYGQVVMDEFSFLGEPGTDSSSGGRPQKMGYMLGTRYVLPCSAGLFRFSLEGVYTDPCLYLREAYSDGTNGVSLYGTLREFQNNCYSGHSVTYLRKCIGYVYGGDAVVGDFKVTYDSLGDFKGGFETFFMAHGIMYNDLNTDWEYGKQTTSPSTEDGTVNPSNASGEVEYILRLSLNGSWDILPWLEVYGRNDNYLVTNKNNVAAAPAWDSQFSFGTKITW